MDTAHPMNARDLLALSALALAALETPSLAEAQSVVVQGQVQYQPYGNPQGVPAPPPGYGVQGQVYVQPAPTYAQPTYAPTYAAVPPQRQIRYVEEQTSIKGLWIPGIIIFGVSYVLTGVMSSSLSFDSDYTSWSWVPLIGPWVALGYAANDDESVGSIIGGIAQAAGLTMFILGISLTRTVRVARYALGEDETAPELAFDLLPTPGGAQLGLTLTHF